MADPASLAMEVQECAERTLATGSARVEIVRDFQWSTPDGPRPWRRRRRGGLLRPLGKLAKLAVRTLWRRMTGGMDFKHLVAAGIAEPANERYMLNYGDEHSELRIGDKQWIGKSGNVLGEPGHFVGPGMHELWWLLELLRGATEAADEGEEPVRGTSCRRLAARVDVSIASAASKDGIRPPTVDRFEELLALPLTAWIDGTHVYRVRFTEGETVHTTFTLELWDFGVDTTQLDWSRLP